MVRQNEVRLSDVEVKLYIPVKLFFNMDVVGVGALNLDKIYRVPRIAKPGEEVFI